MVSCLMPVSKSAVTVFASTAGALGLFVAGLVLPRLLRKPLEVACLSPFVVHIAMQR